jgi:very-short-patch-repair endonuclease
MLLHVTRQPHRPADLAFQVFRGSLAIGDGLVSRDQLRSPAWRRILKDVYADSRLADDHLLRIAGAALVRALVLPEGVVFARRSAACLYDVPLARASDPVELTAPTPTRFWPYAGLRVRHTALVPTDVTRRAGYRVTTPERTALDLAREADLAEAVAGLDALRRAKVADDSELAAHIAVLAGRGSRQARQAWTLSDSRAESPLESRVRVLLALAGLPPHVQFEVTVGGVFVARVDLAYPEHRLAIEVDGAWHADDAQLVRDRRRLNTLQAAGWTVLHFTAADYYRPEQVIAQVRAQVLRAA